MNSSKIEALQELTLLLNKLEKEVRPKQTAVLYTVSREEWQRVLVLLRQYPDLAEASFKWGEYPRMLPFSILLNVHGMSLKHIKEIHEYNPTAISTGLRYSWQQASTSPQFDVSLFPIDFAIRTASDNIIEFVARKFPERRPQVRTLEYLWQSRRTLKGPPVSLETIQMLARQWPIILSPSLKYNTDQVDALVLAFQKNRGPKVLIFLAQSLAQDNNNIYSKPFIVHMTSGGTTHIVRKTNRLICLLPWLGNLELHTNMPDLVERVFSLLSQNSSLTSAEFRLTSRDSSSLDITEKLRCVLATNTHMKCLTLTGDFILDWDGVKSGLQNSKSELRSLNLLRVNEACFPGDWTPLAKVIEENNTVLVRLSVSNKSNLTPVCNGRDKLDHFLVLNSYNRGLARNMPANMSIGTLLNQANDRIKQFRGDRALLRLNVYYGLLRESPALWSKVDKRRRKRRRIG